MNFMFFINGLRGPAPHHPRDARLLPARHWGPHSGHPSVNVIQNKTPD